MTMVLEFIIPAKRDDLFSRISPNQYVVAEAMSRNNILSQLHGLKQACRSQPFAIMDHFDTIFSVIINHLDVEQHILDVTWESLLRVCALLHDSVNLLFNSSNSADTPVNTAVLRYLTSIKMSVYLLCQFIGLFDSENYKSEPLLNKKGKSSMSKQQTMMTPDWLAEREQAVQCLIKFIRLPLSQLYEPPIVEEDFISLVSECLYKLLEQKAIATAAAGFRETRDAIFHGIALLVKRYNHSLSASLKITQMLKHFEHLASPMAQLVEICVNHYGVRTIVGDVMREIGSLPVGGLAGDNIGLKAYSQFLIEMGESVPAAVLPYVSVVLRHLDEESYVMRNGVLGMMGEILVQILSQDGLDKQQRIARDGFFDCLQDHLHDVNAFVRCKVMQIWLNIVNTKCLPLLRQGVLVDVVLGRLQDVSCLVRRYAVQLLTAILKSNPFAAKLTAEELERSYENEKSKLLEMMHHHGLSDKDDPAVVALAAQWDELQPMLEDALMDQSDVELSSSYNSEEDNEGSMLEMVWSLLANQQCTQAIGLLLTVRRLWPDSAIFTSCHAQSLNRSCKGYNDNIDDDDDGGADSDSDAGIMFDCKAILKGIFYEYYRPDFVKIAESSDLPFRQDVNGIEVNEVTKQQVLVQYLKDCLMFAKQIQLAVPRICVLLASKNTSDVHEAIEFFVSSYELGISLALLGIRHMLGLIWSKEPGVKEAVVTAYRRLYLESATGNQRTRALTVVMSVSNLVHGASLGDLTALGYLVSMMITSGELHYEVIQVLMERFCLKIPDTSPVESRTALIILSMLARAEMEVVTSNMDVLIDEGLGCRAHDDYLLARAACLVLRYLVPEQKKKSTTEFNRLPAEHKIFDKAIQLLVGGLSKAEDSRFWMSLAENVVGLIYHLALQPDCVCDELIHRMSVVVRDAHVSLDAVDGDQDGSADGAGEMDRMCSKLAKLIAVAGLVALQQLIYMEGSVLTELKHHTAWHGADGIQLSKRSSDTADGNDDDMGLSGSSAEDVESEYIRKLCEKSIVTGDNLLAAFRPIVDKVCSDPVQYQHNHLYTAACLTLGKFMTVSSEFCEDHLPLLFTILEKSPSEVIRANNIVIIGDLAFRFPNLIEPWTLHIYSRLRDHSSLVRKYTLHVLNRLILNDMVKLKGQISELASCVIDEDKEISSLAQKIFSDLSRKGNVLYNLLPDAVSCLSDPDMAVSEDNFHAIMRFLFSFIQKDRISESLVEKLCHRLRSATNDRQCRDLAYCLSLLNYSEKSFLKLHENIACYADKLADDDVYACFTSIITKALGSVTKPEAKAAVDELSLRFEQCHLKGVDGRDTMGDVVPPHRLTNVASQKKKGCKTRPSSRAPAGRQRRNKENILEDIIDGESLSIRRVTRQQKSRPNMSLEFDDDIDLFT